MSYLFHETLARDKDLMSRIHSARITICGAGALGSNLAMSLARAGFHNLKIIDRDRVEERNLSTQIFEFDDVGGQKASLVAHAIFRAVRVEVDAVAKDLVLDNVGKLLRGSDLVVDCFDNSVSREIVADYCKGYGIECLHVGLADGYAEVIWNDDYRVPSASQDDICDYPLARNLVVLAVAVAAETMVIHYRQGDKENRTITLADMNVSRL